MITQQQPHYDPSVLSKLLDESLPVHQVRHIEDHLSDCGQCRERLQEIAGEHQWWNETSEILGGLTFPELEDSYPIQSTGESSSQDSLLDVSLEWIRPLLKKAPNGVGDANAIGRLDQYAVQGVIGQGGMGVVLRGVDPELNRPVAIKVLSPHLAGVGAARARFMREAQAAAAIVHPSVVPIYSVVPTARLPYLVMPCIQGGNLQHRIDREGPLPLEDTLRIGCQVAEGLAAAHRNGLIHRDIKPANILVEEGNGRVLISDFGLARALDDATLTNSGMIAGTPQYMSPEQARGESVDVRSDLFSMGSLLYSLATGRPPFRAETPLGVLRKITETKPKPITEINERMPVWLDALVMQFMQPEVTSRIASADEAATLLRQTYAHVSNPSSNRLPRSLATQRSNRAMVGALTLLCLVLSISIYLITGATETADPTGQANQIQRATVEKDKSILKKRPTSLEDWDAIGIEVELQALNEVVDGLAQQLGGSLIHESE